MGTNRVVEYGSFDQAFSKYLFTQNHEEKMILWEVLVDAMFDLDERRSARNLFNEYMQIAERLGREFISEGCLTSFEYPKVLKGIKDLQELLSIEHV